MARITVEDCLDKEENRFNLVHLAAMRAKQIIKGSNPLIRAKDEKPVVVALREIAAGKVKLIRTDMGVPVGQESLGVGPAATGK